MYCTKRIFVTYENTEDKSKKVVSKDFTKRGKKEFQDFEGIEKKITQKTYPNNQWTAGHL